MMRRTIGALTAAIQTVGRAQVSTGGPASGRLCSPPITVPGWHVS